MRSVGLVPATAVVVGAAIGTAFGAGNFALAPGMAWLPVLFLCLSLLAWYRGRVGRRHPVDGPHLSRATVLLVAVGFLCAALVLGARGRDEALHPSLRTLLDAEYGGFALGS